MKAVQDGMAAGHGHRLFAYIDALYAFGEEVESNAIEVHLHNLRRKLGTAAICNVRGVGYRVADA